MKKVIPDKPDQEDNVMLIKKTVFITGSTKGIGYSFYSYLKGNYTVITHGRSDLDNCFHIKCDLAKKNSAALIRKRLSSFGKIDMFIHNCYIDQISISMNLIESLAPFIKKKGKIILISSGLAKNNRHLNDFTDRYSVVKAGLEKFMKIMSDRYYKEEIAFSILQIDRTYDTSLTKSFNAEKYDMQELNDCLDFFMERDWDELTGRCFISSGIINRAECHNMELNYQHLGKKDIGTKFFQGNRVFLNQNKVTNENMPDEVLSAYNTYQMKLHECLAELHNTGTENINLHKGILNFLEVMINVMVKQDHDIVSFDPSWNIMKDIAHERNVINDNLKISEKRFIPDYEKMAENIGSMTRLIYLVAPLNRLSLILFLTRIPGNIPVIIDFCYNDFIPSEENIQMNEFTEIKMPIIAVNTFSKFYGLPGLKLSYSVSNKEMSALINRFFHKPIDHKTEMKAVSVLSDVQYHEKVRSFYKKEMDKYIRFLNDKNIDYIVNTPMSLLLMNTSFRIPEDLSSYIVPDENGVLVTIQKSSINDLIIEELNAEIS